MWKNDGVEIIANDQGNRTTPSYVAFTDTERLIGDAAKNQVARNPENTATCSKMIWRIVKKNLIMIMASNCLRKSPFGRDLVKLDEID